MKKNVLVFNGGNSAGILIGRALNMSVLYHAVACSSYKEHSMFCFDDCYSDLPFIQDKDFIEELNRLIELKNISFIIPTHDSIALSLMENQKKINAIVVCSPLETTFICRYKSETYKKFKGFDFVPFWFFCNLLPSKIDFPIFAKPDDGQGGKGAVVIHNQSELCQVLKKNYVFCEYLSGNEYTVDCFTNQSRELIFVNPRERAEITDGKTSLSETVVEKERFLQIAEKINERLHFRGYWFIQLKEDKNGELKLLEISTRFAGGFAHSQALEINLPVMAVSDFDSKDVNVCSNDYSLRIGKAFVDRYEISLNYDRVYIDYDDTITCNNGNDVNSLVLAWLYQLKNKGKEIFLLSYHSATKNSKLLDDMNRLCISEKLFSKIYDLQTNEKKENFIKLDKPCIFIDNSFAQRQKVKSKCHISVFDVCHVDCLYDWKKL